MRLPIAGLITCLPAGHHHGARPRAGRKYPHGDAYVQAREGLAGALPTWQHLPTYLPTPYDDGDNHLWFVWGIMITVGGWQYDDDFNRTVNLRSSRLDFAFLFVSSPEITQFLD